MEWREVNKWRRETRNEILVARLARPLAVRKATRDRIVEHLGREMPWLGRGGFGFYWPFRGELDLRDFAAAATSGGGAMALPVVVKEKQPVEFWEWCPETKMVPGVWSIPVPASRKPIQPPALLIPLLGFDDAGYRLGYGGGYYDRTLAAAAGKPLAIGVGYAVDRLATIHPQPHDIPMDAIVTEEGVRWISARNPLAAGPVSAGDAGEPPCMMSEADPAYMGYLTDEETAAFLNELLEGERAGARGVIEMARATPDLELRVALSAVAQDEARYCAMLSRHIERLGGQPSIETGAFLDKLRDTADQQAKIELLNKGQSWVARRLVEFLPKIADPDLYDDLCEMREVHDRNVARCARFTQLPA
ncbi:5-formyltetrahydrofolate cyclo-ligase [Thalassospiraceae bacterium LMO-SO8]|nr:5-formyltetrahydrofolate cyclo-ligase [Alphaproteobacteria bacterium LMO-S08]WND74558.1 5-formyltetrahydrofolate cyclo-ligase [Thalassospiraceae bacterium LMO-SO8]